MEKNKSILQAGSKELNEIISKMRFLAFDFDGVFTDNMVYVLEDGREAVRCSRGDGMGITLLRKAGFPMIIISTEANPVVTVRAKKLKMECIQNCDNKRIALEEIVARMGISLEQVAFMGNDVNDLPCLSIAGLPIVVADAHEDVIPAARYVTKAAGGNGAVREVCDLFLKVIDVMKE